jgi:hypothetical protein
MSDDYEIGYKKPPRHTRFKKGQSGNPKGRPKKAPAQPADNSAAAILKRVGDRTVEINGQTHTFLELEFLSLQTKAAKGDIPASRQLSRLRKDLGLFVPAQPSSGGGVLVVPGMMDDADFEKLAFNQQAKFRAKHDEEDED